MTGGFENNSTTTNKRTVLFSFTSFYLSVWQAQLVVTSRFCLVTDARGQRYEALAQASCTQDSILKWSEK